MKTGKLESIIAYFIITSGIFLLNISSLSPISLIIGSVIGLLLILLFDSLKLYKYTIVRIIIFIISFIFIIFYLNKITYFISDNILRNYSTIAISFTLILTLYLLVNKGYHTIIKVIELTSYFILISLIIGIIFLAFYINPDYINLNSIRGNNIFNESLYYALLTLYTYILVYPMTKKKLNKKGFIFTNIHNFFIYLLTISVLGKTLTTLYKYPFIIMLKKINLIGFIERIEIIFSITYLFTFFYLILLSFYQIKYLLNLKIKKDKTLKIILSLIILIIFFISFVIQ